MHDSQERRTTAHHESRSTERPALHVLAHTGLRPYFDTPDNPLGSIWLPGDRIGFVDEADLTEPGRVLHLPIFLPITSEFQADALRDVRLHHPMSLLVAVTTDVTGYRTYYAIRSGADFVVNLAIGFEQADALTAQLQAQQAYAPGSGAVPATAQAVPGRLRLADHRVPASARPSERWSGPGSEAWSEAWSEPPGVAGPGGRGPADRLLPHPAPPHPAPRPASLADSERTLVRLLCTSMTVSEIARHHYCSERSMYRRIRRLYDHLDVGNRTELVTLAAALGLNRPTAARGAS
ncbi:helix-turn-helix domain-containing protein [Streptomyces sp. SP17BM10]|uniref:helix-turn-helix transcriptional regulator n=1 Tax=Streptomyces sp. SP17BM10 TaxID=3002530 RepID=UPI002E78B54E|nr:helix-turn-helix domain-containing protein [Streptomyces sp. SP17BM10]MEE1786410.1 helix-turn-helix domain-containing protein [Streptomyces sp. SP17BM10]